MYSRGMETGGENLIGVTKAAEIAGTTRATIYAAIRRGELKPVPKIPVVLLVQSDVEQFAKREVSKGGRPKKIRASGKQE